MWNPSIMPLCLEIILLTSNTKVEDKSARVIHIYWYHYVSHSPNTISIPSDAVSSIQHALSQ